MLYHNIYSYRHWIIFSNVFVNSKSVQNWRKMFLTRNPNQTIYFTIKLLSTRVKIIKLENLECENNSYETIKILSSPTPTDRVVKMIND